MAIRPDSLTNFVSRNRGEPRRAGIENGEDFRDYACRNRACVLSKFEKFSMTFSPDPRCPICSGRIFESDDPEIASKPS